MGKIFIFIAALGLFLAFSFLVWKSTQGFMKKEYSKKFRKNWGFKMYHYTFILMVGGGFTVLFIKLLENTGLINP
ncbi:hypothetical protein GCM10009117_00510 [Gangjinia marincola]|uniref:Uncharacterized protein n=1 Tax=Gangjinia marincola TaxID=578463 RepID=A0ABN1MCS9_9FLAO